MALATRVLSKNRSLSLSIHPFLRGAGVCLPCLTASEPWTRRGLVLLSSASSTTRVSASNSNSNFSKSLKPSLKRTNNNQLRMVATTSPANAGSEQSNGSGAAPAPVDTSARLRDLRQEMEKNGVKAYIVPTEDAHQVGFKLDFGLGSNGCA